MSWFLYLIECADDSVYTGITTDVAARFDEHASGKGARYTRSRKPRAVLASFPLPDRSIASRAEYWVKRLTAAQKRELAAGIRTLESVLPAGMSIDGNVDAAVPQDGTRGKKKVKAKRADIANGPAETEEARDKAAKSGTAGKKTASAKTAKTRRAATTPTSAKASPVSRKHTGTADDTEGKKTASRGTPAKLNKPATNALPKRKASAAGGKPAANGLAAPASAPARGRPSARKTTAEVIEAAPARRATGAKRAKAAPSAGAQPAPARKKTLARATARTKQNRAAS
ncbi:excinuclease ABC subunit C [Burkholderia sp. MSMB0856]|uniref:GIY-YIG nuclease family protein n=1 Tax=Burkholderia sp. MSMB0856 TaxID=1637869 RepID=UPI00075A6C84|nr:GIY-YIG nuclease family protein [Burkholderia sp. MSMB0856]AOJ87502.1 excinuclease ABC subunit C [Burkholderia sp. MSMB0856]KVH30956.1 excinuclease ABC subunit C [Burkholderia sp. MSMB0856]